MSFLKKHGITDQLVSSGIWANQPIEWYHYLTSLPRKKLIAIKIKPPITAGNHPEIVRFRGITHATSFSARVGTIQNPRIQNGISHSSANPRVVTVKTVLNSRASLSIKKNRQLKAAAITIALLRCPWKEIPGIAGRAHRKTRESKSSRSRNLII
jgi:hypothetical protein